MSLNFKKTFLLLFALFAILIIIPTSFAYDNDEIMDSNDDSLAAANDVIYVSTTGNDTNDGSQDNPLATVKRALTLANSNNQSQIYILTGVYEEYDLEILSNVDITGLGNVTIDSQAKGRIFTIDKDLKVNLENLNLINGEGQDDIYIPYSGYQNGAGAIYVGDSLVTMNNLTFIGNQATSCGGAIVWDGRNGVIRNSRFIDNYGGTYGGAIDWEGDNGRIENCTFISNQAENGGALFYEGYVLNLINSHFESNVAGWGGAVSIISTSQSDDNYVTGNTFIRNEADSYGGAIVLDNEQLVSCSSYTIISKNKFDANIAAYGGAISSYYANTDVISNIFTNHTSASYGGVIASSGVLYLQNNTMKNSKASTIGNEIYNVGTFEGFLNITFIDGKTVNVTGQSIRLNATVTDDMGNAISGGSVKFTVNGTETLYSPSVLTEGFCHVAFAPRLNGTYIISGNYGSVSGRYSNVTVGYIVVTNASADYFGPIYLSEELGNDANVGSESSPVATFEVAYSLASREGASKTIIIRPGHYEVARYDISFTSFTIIGEGNPILDAGDKFMFSFTGYASNVFNVTGVTLANGYAASSTYAGNYAGGAIFFKGGHLYLKDVSFINNTAEDFGGAIHVNKGFNLNSGATYVGEATIINCTFINNQVIGHDSYDRNVGGAISTYGGEVTIINSTFTGNYARFGGALGIEQYHGGMTVINSTFSDNEASRFGGAIYFDTVTPFTAEIYNSTFDGNTAMTGGAVYIGDGVVDGCDFTNNRASNAGALLVEGDDVITNNNFENNTADKVGGAIVINKNPSQVFTNVFTVKLENNTITDCRAENASEIYLDNKLYVSGLQITVLDNSTKFFTPSASSTIYANVTDDMGNSISTSSFAFIIDGEYFNTTVNDGVASIERLITLDDNNKVVSADILAVKNNVTVKTGIIRLATGEIIIDFNDVSGIIGENITIPVQVLDEDGNPIDSGILTVIFNSKTFNATISNGVSNVEIALPDEIGIYPVTTQYGNVSLTRNVTVLKASPTISIEANDSFVGLNESIIIKLNDDAVGDISVIIDNETFTKTLENGLASLEISNLENRTYTVIVVYNGNEKYNNASVNATFNVFKVADYEISAKTNQISEGENLTVSVDLPKDAKSNVTVTIADKNYTESVIDGTATFNIENLKAGQYKLTATYSGDDKYTEKSAEIDVIVSKVSDYEMSVNSSVSREGDNTTVVIALPEDANGKVIVSISNKTYEADVLNGSAVLNITDLKEGTYEMNVTYNGDSKYLKKSIKDNVTVISPINVKLTVDDVEKFYGGTERLIVNLFDLDNNPLDNVSVFITINHVTYTRTVVNGTASLGLNLNPDTYEVNVLFNGTDDYDAVSVNASVLIKSTINASDIVKVFRNGTQFYASALDSQGNPLAKTNLTFNINGVLYNRTTNEEGIARLNINLNSGVYIITSINTVTGQRIANNITVIGKIIENNDLTKYYKNDSQYHVKVLDDEGNAVGAGVDVSFNINGVFYHRLTDENGIAKLNINLQPGDFIITAEYGGYAVSNNIKVLSVLSAEDLHMSYLDGQKFEAKLLDGQGNPFKGQGVLFNINGVLYNRTTDGDGIARLNINLQAGQYIITSMYNGYGIANTITIA
ncbi:MAG: Ig-like domain repeat protein [Methanobrevibacter sp.]|uniref:Ig-like domain repeat protein n=1 Tax=Methanobrevibacter sp. TaxID=66852 RepID=UPI0025E8640C|nr:Ig-like domain repeat protein [Methanobrevibacter sp.]MBR0272271.1 Ig-like domain repeat protein [Methanobrevibacter sp.]